MTACADYLLVEIATSATDLETCSVLELVPQPFANAGLARLQSFERQLALLEDLYSHWYFGSTQEL